MSRAGTWWRRIAAFAIIVAGVVGGLLPWPTLIALAAVPIALRVHQGIKVHYDSPYTLMAVMGTNVNLNLVVGGLLLVGLRCVTSDHLVARCAGTELTVRHQPSVPGSPLIGPTIVIGDPAAVEAAGLRAHDLVVHGRLVDRPA